VPATRGHLSYPPGADPRTPGGMSDGEAKISDMRPEIA
jgi:hypothetical protein